MATANINVSGATFTSQADVLAALQKGLIPMDVALQLIERFSTKGNKPVGAQGIYFKVSEKGAVSVYGLQRMPVTLYGEQWNRLLGDEVLGKLKTFIVENDKLLSKKEDKAAK